MRRMIFACVSGLFFLSVYAAFEIVDEFNSFNLNSGKAFKVDHEIALDTLTPDIEDLLKQQFYYLEKGAQVFVFVSEDDEYVLKFVKLKRMRPALWEKALASFPYFNSYGKSQITKKEERVKKLCKSFAIGQKTKEMTGVVYMHLEPADHPNLQVSLTNRWGEKQTINLAESRFYLQKKAKLVKEAIESCMEAKQKDRAKSLLANLAETLVKRCQMGIIDCDVRFLENVGFLESSTVFIDFGEFREDPRIKNPLAYRPYIAEYTKTFINYLDSAYPELAQYFTNKITTL